MRKREIQIYPPIEFADSIPALYAPLKPYVTHVIPLMLEHVWFLKREKATPTFQQLMYCGWLCRLITLDKRVLTSDQQNEISGWPELRDELVKYLDECGNEDQIALMLSSCMELITPILQKRFKDGYRFPERDFYCWWYTIHENNTLMALHLVNAYQPESPFAHREHFVLTMSKAVEHAVSKYPSISRVTCGSWLNNLERFQNLWPESFRLNQKLLNDSGGFGPGAWGQYITTEGGFNENKASVLRRTGKHPFPLTESVSSIEEVTRHLKTAISGFASIESDE
jgi:hypothetical protein